MEYVEKLGFMKKKREKKNVNSKSRELKPKGNKSISEIKQSFQVFICFLNSKQNRKR